MNTSQFVGAVTVAVSLVIWCDPTNRAATIQADPNQGLLSAIRNRNIESIESALTEGADVNYRDKLGRTPLMLAALVGSVDIARLLLDRGADLHAEADGGDLPSGDSALTLAAQEGNVAMVMELLGRGVPVDSADRDGTTALMKAAMRGQLEVLSLLIDSGANPNAANLRGETALMVSAAESIPFLVKYGANVDAVNLAGFTPLMYAAAHSSESAARALRDAGANLSARNNYGETALDIAKRIYTQRGQDKNGLDVLTVNGSPASQEK